MVDILTDLFGAELDLQDKVCRIHDRRDSEKQPVRSLALIPSPSTQNSPVLAA